MVDRLPLVRLISRRLTQLLLPLQVTPNQITFIGTAAGLCAALCYLRGGTAWSLLGAALFSMSYVLDNCDGELARLKGMQSRFGAYFDDLGDWVVHAALFLAIGARMTLDSGEAAWLWLGCAAAFGATMSSVLMVGKGEDMEGEVSRLSDLPPEATWIDVASFILRGLFKADFWLLLLVLTVTDTVWLLLPAAAVGSQVFWLLHLRRTVRRIHT